MAEIIQILRKRKFTKIEANNILPTIKRITTQANIESIKIEEQLRFIPRTEPMFKRFSSELDLIIRRWSIKIKKLGLKPTDIWTVGFETEDGWFTWRLGDEDLSFFQQSNLNTDLQANHTDSDLTKS